MLIRPLFLIFIFAALLAPAERTVQCKCRQVEGGEYACKCVVISGTTPAALEFSTVVPDAEVTATPVKKAAPVAATPKTPAATPTAGGTPTGRTTATGIPIYQGPRGGQYHYSSSGKKVYERKRK